ncbi:NAD(P)H-hydrate dehydratase [Clavibacter michiganensis]|nr:ADP/ATP-dependent (S)-NAD(P)H-hydrate dehydratase [Clavibacter michiganensis]MBT1634234.1 NAD(P)H-hydrate dehydratase [Clavibacter michiganensis]
MVPRPGAAAAFPPAYREGMSDARDDQVPEGWIRQDEERTRRELRLPRDDDDKYTRGVLGVRTGSDRYPGAAVLGVEAAARTGVGMIRYLGPAGASASVLARRPEVVTADGRVQAWLVGSGMDAAHRDDATTDAIAAALAQGLPAVVDAGTLDLVDRATGPVVVTPHFRELSRLLEGAGIRASAEDVAGDAPAWAERAARELGVCVLLKGATTLVVGGSARIAVRAGTPWLATAGSGDVLGGVLGALLAGASTRVAEAADPLAELAGVAAAAAWLHGRAGERASGGGPITALDVAEAMPRAVRDLLARSAEG